MLNASIQISIVVPIYNVEEYLKRCIESIIEQTYKNLEIILVDDGSTDCCPEICDYYSKVDNRIQVIHKKNGGLVSARKAGTAVAKGDYILNVDGDDWIEKDRVEVLVVEGIKSAKSDMIYLSGYKKDYRNGSICIESDIPIKTFYEDEIRKQIFPLLMDVNEGFHTRVKSILVAWAVRRELLQEKQILVDDRISMGEDIICIWFCLLSARSVTFVKQDGYHYVQRSSSLSHTAAISLGDDYSRMKIWYQQLKEYLEMYNDSKEINQIFIYTTIWSIMLANYELLLKKHPQYLYPFTKVKKGHKIVVYGAGRIGQSLLQYLLRTKDNEVTLWVDQNEKESTLLGYKVSSIEDIIKVNYDYIVIAVMDAYLIRGIKQYLITKGIPEQKIAIMDVSVMSEEAIPNEIKNDRV
ncbi:glycosyltransferase family 2 protein [Acetatifactor muris]|uniref:glycosyltransferase family 2 protein n=1 Tax=Acetatifactor muris TaxID=879566 RepID=UPI0023F477D2|nr:glycosyltransferase [Acetatifactor muris]